MQIAEITEQQRRCILDVLLPHAPAAIYVFGSTGTDRQHDASDVDIAVLRRFPLDPLVCFQLAGALADALGCEVDLVDLSGASTVLAKEVIRTGSVVYEADETLRQYFEMRTLSDYARLNEERAEILRQVA